MRTNNYRSTQTITVAFIVWLVCSLFLVAPHSAGAEEVAATGDCAQAVVLIRSQKKEMNRESRQIKREIAALKDAMSKPGLTEVLGGIGYIIGLFGVGFFFQARKQTGGTK